MENDSVFGIEPEQLNELLSLGEDEPENSVVQKERSDETYKTPESSVDIDAFVEQPGSWVGSYKLLSVLGEGGMGIVYLAEQQEPIKRQVALKVVRPGMDSKRVIARFEAEKQALALMQHPHIAGIYDAGITLTGRPYFVMEYVKGQPITDYCDQHKLSINERLQLFQQVCQAVNHAHQKGIIHRDIKPSNILVSVENDQAIPKIIDFGVAKATNKPLTERTLATEDSHLLGTPEYMSPEQADMANEDIDTRSDIYSLGVLLYVLLTGVLPFDSTTFREGGIENIRKIIRETDPKTPSTRLNKLGEEAKKVAENRSIEIGTLEKHLRRELEWIPLKAMRKERAERYRSASELADDIENYLTGVPLIAGPPGAGYKLKKFVRRNRVLVGGVAAVLLVLFVGVVVSTIFAVGQARARTEAQAVADFLRNDLLASVDPERGMGRDVTIRSFLDIASESLNDKFTNEPLVEASIRETIGWTYRQLGELKAAEPHLERALQIRQEHLGVAHLDTLDSVGLLAWLRCGQARYKEASELLEEAITTCRRRWGDEHIKILGFANTLGCVYIDLGRYDEAEQLYLKSIPIAQHVLGAKNNLSLFMEGNLGGTYAAQGRYKEAEHQCLKTLRLREGFWDDENIWTLVYKSLLAEVYIKQKRYEEAQRLYLQILPIQHRVDGDKNIRTIRSMRGLAQVYTHLDKYDEAENLFSDAMKNHQTVFGREHRDTLRCMNGLAKLYIAQGRFDKAESLLTEALEISRRTLGDEHPLTLTTVNNLAIVNKEQANYKDAEDLLIEAFEGRTQKLGKQHPDTEESLKNLIALYEAWNKPEKAKEWRAKLPKEN